MRELNQTHLPMMYARGVVARKNISRIVVSATPFVPPTVRNVNQQRRISTKQMSDLTKIANHSKHEMSCSRFATLGENDLVGR